MDKISQREASLRNIVARSEAKKLARGETLCSWCEHQTTNIWCIKYGDDPFKHEDVCEGCLPDDVRVLLALREP